MLPQDMSHLRTERDNAWLRTADRAVAESPVKYCLSEQGYSFKGQTKAVGPRSCCVRRCAVACACMRCLPRVTNGRVCLRAASRMNTRRYLEKAVPILPPVGSEHDPGEEKEVNPRLAANISVHFRFRPGINPVPEDSGKNHTE